MRVAFYAPLKPPDAPTPSGDRQMARQIISALECSGHRVELAARLRSRDGAGDATRQRRVRRIGEWLARRYVCDCRARPANQRPQAWITYHLYHKAPDWIGPTVASALAIPYVAIEASYAPKQAAGPWAEGHDAVARALRAAAAIVSLNSRDEPCLRPLVQAPGRLFRLPPFTDIRPYAAASVARSSHRQRICRAHDLDPGQPLLLAVGMMRHGDKLDSYRVLGRTLGHMRETAWQLLVVGDGAARDEVAEALAPCAARTRFTGERPAAALPEFYAAADLFVWPACREAYGLALLEAQATGTPVVAGDSGGVPDIVRHGETGLLAPEGDAAALAACAKALLADPGRREKMGRSAAKAAARYHGLTGAGAALNRILAAICLEAA